MPPALRGIADTPVRALAVGGLAPLEAWVGTVADTELSAMGGELVTKALAHNEVVNAALATGQTPVPARFGCSFQNDESLVSDLSGRRDDLSATLDRVADAVEIPVLIVPTGPPLERPIRPDRHEAAAGRRYLDTLRRHAEAEAARRAVVDATAEHLSAAVGNFVRGEVRSRDRRGVVSLAHLVSHRLLERYHEKIAALGTAPGARIVTGEKRAPYSFAELRVSQVGHDFSSPSSNE
jgi:hypothetical protein